MNKSKLPTIALTLVVTVITFLVASASLAAITIERETAAVGIYSTSGDSKSPRGRHHRLVRCDHGQLLTHALRRARAGDTIRISGTCVESVLITTDRLTIKAATPGATIDGSGGASEAVVLVDGARGIRLVDLTIQNGADQGLLATHQAQILLENVSMNRNGTIGLSVDRSHVELQNVNVDDNRGGGMDAYSGSTVLAKGRLSANGNGGDGLAANGKTFFELRGAAVTANNNAGSGVSIINDSRLQIFSFPEAQGTTLTADDNGFAGVGLLGAELGVVGSQFFGSGANVITANNNFAGFFMPGGGILSPHATARFVATNNVFGMLMEDGARALIVGGLDINQNLTGVSAMGAGTVSLVSVPPNPSLVDRNERDIDLGFGTRATLDGLTTTSLSCDSTVLLRGSIACP